MSLLARSRRVDRKQLTADIERRADIVRLAGGVRSLRAPNFPFQDDGDTLGRDFVGDTDMARLSTARDVVSLVSSILIATQLALATAVLAQDPIVGTWAGKLSRPDEEPRVETRVSLCRRKEE